MAVDVHDLCAMLLSACRDEQVRDGDAMMTYGGELTLCGQSRRERLGIHAQVAKEREVIFQALVVVMRASAVQQLETCDRA